VGEGARHTETVTTVEGTMTEGGTGVDPEAGAQDTGQSLEALGEAEGRLNPKVHMKEEGADPKVPMKGGDPELVAEKGEDHLLAPVQGHMKGEEVPLQEDQGHTVTLLRGHQDMERMSPQQEMVTVVVEVEALIQVLTINSFMMNKTSILKMLP